MQKLIKRVGDYSFTLADMIDHYRHLPIHTPAGEAKVLDVDRIEEEVVVQLHSKDEKDAIRRFKSSEVKLQLIPFTRLTPREWNKVANLATDTRTTFSVRSSTNQTTMVSRDTEVIVTRNPSFDIFVVNKGEPGPARNIPFIIMFMTQKGVDLFHLLQTQFARVR